MPTGEGGPSPVQSVGRALDLLEALAVHAPLGVIDLARQVGLAQGTTHRLLATLADRGYVRQDSERRYHLGPAGSRLADAAGRELAVLARPVLARLVERIGETANLAVLDTDAMVYIAQAPSPHTLRIFAEVGRRVPIHSTAVGKAVVAQLTGSERDMVLDKLRFEARTSYTVTTRAQFDLAVAQVERDGFAIDEQEQEIGVRCVSVALPELGGALRGVRAAISVSGPAERFTPERAHAAAPLLLPIATELAHLLSPT